MQPTNNNPPKWKFSDLAKKYDEIMQKSAAAGGGPISSQNTTTTTTLQSRPLVLDPMLSGGAISADTTVVVPSSTTPQPPAETTESSASQVSARAKYVIARQAYKKEINAAESNAQLPASAATDTFSLTQEEVDQLYKELKIKADDPSNEPAFRKNSLITRTNTLIEKINSVTISKVESGESNKKKEERANNVQLIKKYAYLLTLELQNPALSGIMNEKELEELVHSIAHGIGVNDEEDHVNWDQLEIGLVTTETDKDLKRITPKNISQERERIDHVLNQIEQEKSPSSTLALLERAIFNTFCRRMRISFSRSDFEGQHQKSEWLPFQALVRAFIE